MSTHIVSMKQKEFGTVLKGIGFGNQLIWYVFVRASAKWARVVTLWMLCHKIACLFGFCQHVKLIAMEIIFIVFFCAFIFRCTAFFRVTRSLLRDRQKCNNITTNHYSSISTYTFPEKNCILRIFQQENLKTFTQICCSYNSRLIRKKYVKMCETYVEKIISVCG